MSSEVSTRRLFAALMLLALGFTSLTQIGCSSPVRRLGIVDELAIAYRDRVWAQRAYNLRFANCNREFEDHFKNGFCEGYSDVCNGGDGYTPALPPEEYRGFEYQCAEGSKCVDSWFAGYPAGVAAAREEDAGSYHKMHVSRMIDQAIVQNNATNTLPSDVPVTKPSASLIPPTAPSVATRKFGERPAMPTFSNPPRPASTLQPKSASIKSASSKSASSAPVRVAKSPAKKAPSVLSKPPIVKPDSGKKMPPVIKAPKQIPSKAAPAPVGSGAGKALPPIVPGGGVASSTPARPSVVRGRKIDPSASVSSSEIPLPFAVRSSFDTRTAAWPTTNRK